MSRQLRISDDVHEMLSLLKPFPSTSYDEIIHILIEDVCPSLPAKLENLKLLEKVDPKKAAGERLLIQQELLQDVFINRAQEERENEKSLAQEEYVKSTMTEKQLKEEKEWEIFVEQRRQQKREKLLREQGRAKKDE